MTEDEPTKDLTSDLTDRQILLELRQAVGTLIERVTTLEHRTNPLPQNYDERFTAMEERLARVERSVGETNVQMREMREDLERERRLRFGIEDRLAALEQRPN